LGDDYEYFNISDECAASIVLLSGNYPGNYKTGYVIEGLDEVIDDDLIVFHGETKKNIFGEILTNGGRVLTLTTTASTLNRAYERVYDSVDLISFQDLRYRKDIAKAFIGENNLLL